MKAAKISQTVVLPKPDNAQRADSAGEGSTSLNEAATETPMRPDAAAGIGSSTRATTVAAKTAKYHQADDVSPPGAGSNARTTATTTGAATLMRPVFIRAFR